VTDNAEWENKLIAKAIHILQQRGNTGALELMKRCSQFVFEDDPNGHGGEPLVIYLVGDVLLNDVLIRNRETDYGYTFSDDDAISLQNAFVTAWNAEDETSGSIRLEAKLQLPELNADWKSVLTGEASKEKVLNQGVSINEIHEWQHLRFASPPEVKIAEALDRAGVLFLPNCATRLGPKEKRGNRYPDFLICHNRKWGILEVDGATYHPPENKAQEDERNRLFHHHGIVVIQHYDARRCYSNPDEIVSGFLDLLNKLQ
jgi:hypothetical protein